MCSTISRFEGPCFSRETRERTESKQKTWISGGIRKILKGRIATVMISSKIEVL